MGRVEDAPRRYRPPLVEEGAVTQPRMHLRTPLHHALRVVLLLAAALAATQWVLIAELDAPYGWLLESFGLIGFVTVGIGTWLWARRPANRVGLLLVVVGLWEIAAAFGNSDNRFLVLFGVLSAEAAIAGLAHLVLAFPSGRLRTRLDHGLVIVHYLVSFGFQIPIYVFTPPSPVTFERLHVAGHTDWISRSNDLQGIATGAILVIAAGIVLQRWRTTPVRSQRAPLGAVYLYGIFVLVSFPLTSRVLRPTFDWSVYTLFGIQLLVILGVPFVYGAALLSNGLARTVDIGELATWLTMPDDRRPTLRDALADALGDPSVQLLHAVDGDHRYVDDQGTPHDLPTDDRRRITTVPGRRGHHAVIVSDADLNDPTLVEAAGRVLALAIDQEGLAAELVASRDEVRASRLRIIEQAETERRRLARDLHDGVQGRLVAAALHAGRIASGEAEPGAAARLRNEIDIAITELRELVHGVMPALLVERGLHAAAEELTDRLPLPARLVTTGDASALPPPVASAAYFVLSEALANVVKHARASRVEVHIDVTGGRLHLEVHDDGVGGAALTGSGLRGTFDRVAALDGHVHVDSPTDGGTRLEVVIPCAS